MRLPNSPTLVLASRLVGIVLAFASAPVVARALGPDGRGASAAALAILALMPVLVGFGLPLVVRRRTSMPAALGDAVRTVRILALAAVLPAAALGYLIAPILLPTVDIYATHAFVIGCGAAPLALLWMCDANILLAQSRLVAYSVLNVLPSATFLIAVGIAWPVDALSVGFVLAANVGSTVVTLIVSSLMVRIDMRGGRARPIPLLREGASFAGSQLAEAASYRLDQALALALIGSTEAGFYAVAATVAMVPFAAGQAVGAAAFQRLADESGGRERQLNLSATVVRFGFVAATLASLLLAVMTPWAVPFVFGSQFAPAVIPTLLALIGSTAVASTYVLNSVLVAQGRGWLMTLSQVSGLTVGMALLLLLGPSLGAVGAAVASTLGYLVTAAASTTATRIPISRLFPRRGDLRATIRFLLRGALPDHS
ncbi:lipopolysaccharide biosynthesis protein [Microbacterium sp. PA5]|uniref:lipopolysaccharide biosynthesis protein n=1 Tax=Microbacterium sp. PA5 TaxID=3416654 RepID=UPI003CF169B8